MKLYDIQYSKFIGAEVMESKYIMLELPLKVIKNWKC